MKRRTECLPFEYVRIAGVDQFANPLIGRTIPFNQFATPSDKPTCWGEPVLEPRVISVSAFAVYIDAAGVNRGVTDYGGLILDAHFLDYDEVTPAHQIDLADVTNPRQQSFAGRRLNSTVFTQSRLRRFYATNRGAGYLPPRQCLADTECDNARTYYWPLQVVAFLNTTSTVGSNPAGGLPANFTIRGMFTVDHEWCWRET